MLRNTLILPESDGALAAELFRQAIDALDVVLMVVLGKGDRSQQAVEWADKLAERTRLANGRNARAVVWIRNASLAPVKAELDVLLGTGTRPRAFVLDFYDTLRDSLSTRDEFDPLTLELLFLAGQRVDGGGEA